MNKKISEAIAGIISEQTFTKDALAIMEKAINNVAELENELLIKEQLIDELREGKRDLIESQSKLVNEVSRLKPREDSVNTRERDVTKLEKNAAVSKAESSVYKDVFSIIFRNQTVHRSISKNIAVPVADSGMMGIVQSVSDNEMETIE